MERLTRKETVIARGAEIAACNPENADCDDGCRYGVCRWQEKANIRLKKYEDTDLTPEEIMELKERDTAKAPEVLVNKNDVKVGAIIFKAGTKWYKCQSCGRLVVYRERFCRDCGQRLKWED